jgi:hypothetical protein
VNLELKHVLGPLIALVILAVIGLQTSDALRHSGTWAARPRVRATPAPDPYASLEARLASPHKDLVLASLRDPFAYGRVSAPARRAPERPKAPPPPPKPILTGILADNDPRAFIRYRDRNYTVKIGDLFADLKVVSITRDQVVLDRSNGERMTLQRLTKGD